MFFDTHIEKLYLINGLSRSGNHVFIEWLISSFDKNEVYFLNNVYPKSHFNLYDKNKIDIVKLMNGSAATSNGVDESQSMNEKNIKKLVTQKDMLELLKGNKKTIKVLILSIENNFADILDFFQDKFHNAKKIYKIIILRDILNLMASRFEAEKKVVVELMEKDKDFKWHKYETDSITFAFWTNNYLKSFHRNYITYNYNKFVLDQDFQKELAKKLDIDYNKTEIVKSKFLKGSSFKNNDNPDLIKYFMRWKEHENNDIIQFLMKRKEIMEILCSDFYFCINDENKLIIKDNIIDLKTYKKDNSKKSSKQLLKSKSKKSSKQLSKSKVVNKIS